MQSRCALPNVNLIRANYILHPGKVESPEMQRVVSSLPPGWPRSTGATLQPSPARNCSIWPARVFAWVASRLKSGHFLQMRASSVFLEKSEGRAAWPVPHAGTQRGSRLSRPGWAPLVPPSAPSLTFSAQLPARVGSYLRCETSLPFISSPQ